MIRRVVDEKIIDMCIANLKRGDDKQEVSAILGALDSGNYGYLVKCLVEEASQAASRWPFQIRTKRTKLVSFPFKFEVGDSFCIYNTNNDLMFAEDFHAQAKREKIEITTKHEIASDGRINLIVTRTA